VLVGFGLRGREWSVGRVGHNVVLRSFSPPTCWVARGFPRCKPRIEDESKSTRAVRSSLHSGGGPARSRRRFRDDLCAMLRATVRRSSKNPSSVCAAVIPKGLPFAQRTESLKAPFDCRSAGGPNAGSDAFSPATAIRCFPAYQYIPWEVLRPLCNA